MYVTFLDASQVFDRMNHIVLLRKLLSAMLCPLVLLFLIVLDREECSPLYFVTFI